MGFSISWLRSENVSKADVLARLDVVDTEVANEANEAPPEAFADIRRRLAAKQLEAGSRRAAVDSVFGRGEPQFAVVAATD